MLIRCIVILLYIVIIDSVELDLNFQDKFPEGERKYSELLKKAVSYGECWKEAMSDLYLGCKQLTEEVQSRLAMSFSNCFLKHTGSEQCNCSYDVPISTCLKNSTDRVYSTYTEFYTHTQSICHYLQHRQWQEAAAKTVLTLKENSDEVSKKLDESSKAQSEILHLQHSALYDSKRLLSNNRILNTELQKSRDNARNVYNEFKLTTNEQRLLLFEVFDRVKNLQNFVLGEFTGVYTIIYYIIAAVVIYILTSVPRTSEARVWLILVITLSAAIERLWTSYSIEEEILSMKLLDTNV